ncbi:hypothetical protein WSM22_06360 [Cytophagales bacterium WSM2-2]|nr:hypothetical protein WSM22_06360 [Cytophagales bacterium WSM2-2]
MRRGNAIGEYRLTAAKCQGEKLLSHFRIEMQKLTAEGTEVRRVQIEYKYSQRTFVSSVVKASVCIEMQLTAEYAEVRRV